MLDYDLHSDLKFNLMHKICKEKKLAGYADLNMYSERSMEV